MDLSRFEIVGDKDRAAMIAKQNSRLVRLRWLYISALTGIATISSLFVGNNEIAIRYITIGGVALTINAILMLVNYKLTKPLGQQILAISQLLLDLIVISVVTYDQGGLMSRTIVLYALPITAAGLVFSKRIVYTTAVLSGLGYIASAILSAVDSGNLTLNYAFVPLVFYPAFFIIYAKLVVFLMATNIDETREAAYDSFLALLTHQLKRPASTASSIIDQLEHVPVKNDQDLKRYLRILKSENQTLLHLLNNLLETASFTSFGDAKEPVELSRILQRVAYDVAVGHDRESDLKLSISNMNQNTMGNSGRLQTVMSNVLNNAFQYSASGSPVEVVMRNSGGNVIISIEDQGPGIPKEVKKSLFKKYTLQDNQDTGVKGLGLGLHVSKKIIEAYGGTFNVVTNKLGTKVIIIVKKGNKHD